MHPFSPFSFLRFCRGRTGHKNPQGRNYKIKYEKITKSLLGWAPQIRKNYQKIRKMFFLGGPNPGCIVFFFFFFSYFLAFFLTFPALGGFCALYEPDGIATLFLLPPLAPTGNFLPQNVPPSWDLRTTLSARGKATFRGWGVGMGFGRGSPHRKKRTFLKKWRVQFFSCFV